MMMQLPNLQTQFRSVFNEYMAGPSMPMVTKMSAAESGRAVLEANAQTASTQIVPQYKAQRLLRPLYGKGEPQPPCIGDHPDFEHLRGTDQVEYCPITTMFMDMEGSTRLNLLYSPPEVAKIKNAFICMAIEVVKAFDGHVHRIMGDAVMAYFGGRSVRPEIAAIDGLNCAAVLQLLVQRVVIPRLREDGHDDAFGIRIGLDHGPKDKVLWRAYGYPNMDEITATSFYVDVASKLQHAAGRNQIMVGSSLKQFLDFPDGLLLDPTVAQNGERVKQLYLMPNITDADGKSINYRQHILGWETYLTLSPLSQLPGWSDNGSKPAVLVRASVFKEKDGQYEGEFFPAGTLGQKGKWLLFTTSKLPFLPQLPYTVKCTVENHGADAWKDNKDKGLPEFGNHETSYEIRTQTQHKDLKHWENLKYRGLHYLIVEVRNGHGLLARTKFGVYVE